MGELRVLCTEGDSKHIWNPDNKEQVEAAEELFKKLTKKGYTAWRVDKEGEKSTKMDYFDKYAGKVILTPKIVGG